jgi:hypothetical protein
MFSIDMRLYNVLKGKDFLDMDFVSQSGVDKNADILRRFDGFFLITTEARVSADWETYSKGVAAQSIRDFNLGFQDELEEDLRGRPRKQEAALQAYTKHFPKGHAGKSWKEVEVIVSSSLGEKVSAQTIRTALKSD